MLRFRKNLKSLSHNLDKQDLEEKLKTLRTDKCWSCQYERIYMQILSTKHKHNFFYQSENLFTVVTVIFI